MVLAFLSTREGKRNRQERQRSDTESVTPILLSVGEGNESPAKGRPAETSEKFLKGG